MTSGALGVRLHRGPLAGVERTGLVEDEQRDLRLAHVVEQAGHSGLADILLRGPQLACERDHQRTDRDRVQERVVVGRLEPGQAEQGHRMALDRVGDHVDDRHGLVHVLDAAHARLAEQVDDDGARFLEDARGAGELVDRRGTRFGWRRRMPRRVLRRVGWRVGLCRVRRGRRGSGQRGIEALVRVDPDLAHGAATQAAQLLLVGHDKRAAPERVVDPRCTELVDKYADAQVGHGYAFSQDSASADPFEKKIRHAGAGEADRHCAGLLGCYLNHFCRTDKSKTNGWDSVNSAKRRVAPIPVQHKS